MITIDIMGKPYHIKCPDHAVESLKKSALFLQEKMQKIRESSAMSPSLEHLAVIAALNMAHEFLNADSVACEQINRMEQRLLDWQQKIANVLSQEPFSAE